MLRIIILSLIPDFDTWIKSTHTVCNSIPCSLILSAHLENILSSFDKKYNVPCNVLGYHKHISQNLLCAQLDMSDWHHFFLNIPSEEYNQTGHWLNRLYTGNLSVDLDELPQNETFHQYLGPTRFSKIKVYYYKHAYQTLWCSAAGCLWKLLPKEENQNAKNVSQ